MLKGHRPRIAILGAGPAGIEAGLYASALELPFTIYERGEAAHNVRDWGHVRLFTPWGQNTTPLGRARLLSDRPRLKLPEDGDILTGRELAEAYLAPLAESLGAAVRTKSLVMQCGRKGCLREDPVSQRAKSPFVLLVRSSDGKESVEEADVVLDCTGTYGNARFLGDGGILAVGELGARPHIATGLEDILGSRATEYADRTVLVVGSGHSAATTVCLLAQLAQKHQSTWIIWLGRHPGSTPLKRVVGDPLRERDQLAAQANKLATRGEGNVEYHPSSIIQSILHKGKDGFTVTALCNGEEKAWEVDRVIANVGYEPERRIYRELQVNEDLEHSAPAPLKQPEPGFHALGAKSQGRSPSYLMSKGHEQVREVFALITGQPGLDLYKARKK